MKTILNVRGPGSCGKSTTLRMLGNLIKQAYPHAHVEETVFKHDATSIITIKRTKVGIETQGDPNSRLARSLSRFAEIPCKVIICASRSRGGTVKIVDEMAALGYRLQVFNKTKTADPRGHLAANRELANRMLLALQALI